MSVSYSPLSQGRGEEVQNQNQNGPKAPAEAPRASEEFDDMDGETKTGNEVNGKTVPHLMVTDEKNDNMVDDIDGHMNLGDLRANTPHSIGRSHHLGLNFDTELGSIVGETIPDINVYQHKKTLAQGMMDLALFSANANQLRYVLDSYNRHPYYWPSMICICLSLALQVAIGVGLIWNALYDVKDRKEICIANKINNWCVIGIFLVVVVNVFISSFGVADPVSVPVQISPISAPVSAVAVSAPPTG